MDVSRRRTTEWLILVAITALAAWLRLYRLADWPPGLHYDEAFHQVEAIGVLDGHWSLYFPENMGMDPLYIYLIALLYRVFGVTHIGGRIVSALAGTLAVPATWWLAQELFADWERPRRLALSAAAAFVLATMQWHITMSRAGIQPNLVPLFVVLTMACLWRGLRAGGLGWFAAAGVLLGAGQYAYLSARMIPLLIGVVGLWLILFDRLTWRRRWPGLLLTAGVSILVFSPLGYYFVTHWEWFTYRAGQVTFYTLGEGSSGPLQTLWQNTVRTLAMFSFRGDVDIIRNLPGRPVFDPFQSLLFVLGIGACLWRIRRPAYAGLLAWLGIMLLPTILTEYAPHYARALGAAPAAAVLAGLGTLVAWQGVTHWAPRGHTVTALVLAAGLVASGVGHGYAYMVRWGSLPELDLPYDVGLLETARAVHERVPASQVYLSPIAMGHPIMRFMLWDRPGARSYDGRYALVLPAPAGRPVDYIIVPSLDDRSLPRLQALYPDGEIVATGGGPRDRSYYQVYRVPPGARAALAPAQAAPVSWADQIALLGYDANQEQYRPGETVVLTLYWQAQAPVDQSPSQVDKPLTAFVHLLGPDRAGTGSPVWVGWDQEPGRASYATSAWQPGEVILDEYTLYLPPEIPPGVYDLEVGWYHLETMQRLPISHAGVQAGPDYAIIGSIFVVK